MTMQYQTTEYIYNNNTKGQTTYHLASLLVEIRSVEVWELIIYNDFERLSNHRQITLDILSIVT